MNLSGPMSHLYFCDGCSAQCERHELNTEHLCPECSASLKAELEAELAEALLSDSEIADAFLEEQS